MKEEKELTPWENWILNNELKPDSSAALFDKLCDLVVTNYNLDSDSRKSDLKDRVHFFVEWWLENKEKSKRYRSKRSIDRLLKKKHGSVYNYLEKRTKTLNYEENTKCIKDFLES